MGRRLRFFLILFADRARPAHLRLRALLDPLGLDAAAADDRRLSVRLQMVLRLFALFAALRHPIDFSGRILGGTPERGDVVVFRHPGRGQGPREAGDRPARRHDRGARRRGDPERPRRCPASASPIMPCRSARTARARAPAARSGESRTRRARQICLYPRFRETLPGGRSYDVLDQIDRLATATPSARCRCPRASCS